jgi:hypothetical protein
LFLAPTWISKTSFLDCPFSNGVPLKLVAGWKRSEVVEDRYRPAELVRPALISVQMEEPLACHCHLPWAEVAVLAVMTTPSIIHLIWFGSQEA